MVPKVSTVILRYTTNEFEAAAWATLVLVTLIIILCMLISRLLRGVDFGSTVMRLMVQCYTMTHRKAATVRSRKLVKRVRRIPRTSALRKIPRSKTQIPVATPTSVPSRSSTLPSGFRIPDALCCGNNSRRTGCTAVEEVQGNKQRGNPPVQAPPLLLADDRCSKSSTRQSSIKDSTSPLPIPEPNVDLSKPVEQVTSVYSMPQRVKISSFPATASSSTWHCTPEVGTGIGQYEPLPPGDLSAFSSTISNLRTPCRPSPRLRKRVLEDACGPQVFCQLPPKGQLYTISLIIKTCKVPGDDWNTRMSTLMRSRLGKPGKSWALSISIIGRDKTVTLALSTVVSLLAVGGIMDQYLAKLQDFSITLPKEPPNEQKVNPAHIEALGGQISSNFRPKKISWAGNASYFPFPFVSLHQRSLGRIKDLSIDSDASIMCVLGFLRNTNGLERLRISTSHRPAAEDAATMPPDSKVVFRKLKDVTFECSTEFCKVMEARVQWPVLRSRSWGPYKH